jgi:hypothetical protein
MIENFSVQHGYATPKIDVRGAVVQDGKILLVQEKMDQRWCMSGSWGDDFPSSRSIKIKPENSIVGSSFLLPRCIAKSFVK